MFQIIRPIKLNGFWCSLTRKVATLSWLITTEPLCQILTVDMSYCTALRIYNVHLEYNNFLYKILINKRLITITYGTTSMPFYMI